MQHRVRTAHGRGHGDRVEQVEFGVAGGTHLMPDGFRERQERSAKNTASSGYQQTHGISLLAAGLCDQHVMKQFAPGRHPKVPAGWNLPCGAGHQRARDRLFAAEDQGTSLTSIFRQ